MAFTIPTPPIIRPSSLKAETRVLLAGHSLRARARRAPEEAIKITLTPWVPSIHGASFLLYAWISAAQTQEHVKVFGPAAETVEGFVQSYQRAELVVLHRTEVEDWMRGQAWLALAFLDETDGQARTRVHHYVKPEYRTPAMTDGLGRLTLQYLFESRGFAEVYGLTPAVNVGARRFAKRMGFRPYGVKAMMYDGGLVEGLETVLTREEWIATRMIEG